MGIQTYKAKVAEHSYLAKKFQNIHLELMEPNQLEFEAGQYVMIKVPGLEGMRQYSISSPPSTKHAIELLVDVVPNGVGSTYLASLKPGDEVEFMAPAGKFVVAEETKKIEKELMFVATGSGIAPIRSMLEDLLIDKKDKRQMWLHWGLRFEEDVFWFDEFARLSEDHENFTFDLTLSKSSEEWKLCRGHVTQCVIDHHNRNGDNGLSFGKIGAHLCGSKRMIEEVTSELLEKGVSKERIHSEQFYD